MPTKAYSYIRMSRPEQLRGDSLRRQLEASKAYAAKNGLDLDDSLRDLGLSAYSGAHRTRGALGAFIALVERGEISPGSVLIIESLDRLSREAVLDALEQFSALIRRGITIVTLADDQTYSRESIKSDWTKLLVSLAIMSRAHEESVMKAQRGGATWTRKRKEALTKPLTARCPAWLRLVNGRFEVIEERAEVVRRVFEETAAGLGKRAVAVRLNRERIQPWGKGKSSSKPHRGWQPSYVSKLLGSEAAIGVMQPHRKVDGRRQPEGEPLRDYYPAVVSERLYWKAKAASAARQTGSAGRRGKAYSNVFSGLARCSCGGVMVYVDKGLPPKGGRYLTCDRARRGLPCQDVRHWRYDVVERVVLDNIGRADLARVLGRDDTVSKMAAEIETLRARLSAAEETERKMLAAFEGAPTKAVAERLRKLEAEDRSMRAHLRALEIKHSELAHSHVDMPGRLAAIEALREQMATLSGDELYRLRARLAQELKRTLKELRFTANNILAFYAIPRPGKVSRLALPDRAGHPLIPPSGDEMPGDDAEDYVATSSRRPRAVRR